jgi:glycosyltransferase involved in cell wall biosynthesis
MTLSILIPAYNERHFIRETIERVLRAQLPEGMERELIVVDDGSIDGTRDILAKIEAEHSNVRVHQQDRNQGKGAAIRKAIELASGDLCIIQDADLEYDPNDYTSLLQPIIDGDADVVYGSRFAASRYRRVLFFWHTIGNRLLTLTSNAFTNLNLTDMETGYKVVKTSILKSIPIRSNRFGMEPELTAKLAKRGCRIYEVPISYRGRSYQEGKKITWKDGVKAFITIVYYWLVDDIYEERYGHDILYSLSRTHRFNRWMADTIRPYVGERVLEIGGGLGNLTLKLIPREHYTVSDRDALHLDYLRSRFRDYPSVDVRSLDLESHEDFADIQRHFDTIVCLNVLEHVPDHTRALKNMFDALRPGGTAIILVPHVQLLYGSLDRVLEHQLRYSKRLLRERCESAGFEIDQLVGFNRIGFLPWLIFGRILRRTKFGKLQLKIFDSFVWLWRVLEHVLPVPGLSIIAVARRPRDTPETG